MAFGVVLLQADRLPQRGGRGFQFSQWEALAPG